MSNELHGKRNGDQAPASGNQASLIGRRAEHEAPASGDAGVPEPEANESNAGANVPVTTQPSATPWYLSRTLWINVAALASLIVPSVRDWLAANPVEFTSALGAINVLLRFVTVGKYQLAEPHGVPDVGADESAPAASIASRPGGSADLSTLKAYLDKTSFL